MSATHNHSALSKVSFAGLLITIGIVFGDIGTSPLYVVKAIISGADHFNQVIGLWGFVLCVLDTDFTDNIEICDYHPQG